MQKNIYVVNRQKADRSLMCCFSTGCLVPCIDYAVLSHNLKDDYVIRTPDYLKNVAKRLNNQKRPYFVLIAFRLLFRAIVYTAIKRVKNEKTHTHTLRRIVVNELKDVHITMAISTV